MLQYEYTTKYRLKGTTFRKGDKVKTLDFWLTSHLVVGGEIGTIKYFKEGNAMLQEETGLCTFWDAEYLELID